MKTKIEWTQGGKTWNPIKARLKEDLKISRLVKVAGEIENHKGRRVRPKVEEFRIIPAGKVGYHCERVSPGCKLCYAGKGNCRTLPAWGTGLDYTVPNRELVDIFLDEKVLAEPLGWKKPCYCFPCSMTDLFGEFVPDEFIDRMFAVMALTPHITYQVLTKRARRMREYFSHPHRHAFIMLTAGKIAGERWKSQNVFPPADERIPELLWTPAALRFVSYEPALAEVDFTSYLYPPRTRRYSEPMA